jgi:mRNA interferase MazF
VAAPERGDLVWLSLSPHAGRAQAGRRPALVLSPRAYHQKTGYALVCPITSRIKGYPFEVVLPEGLPVRGAVLADQLKSIDRPARQIEVVARAPDMVIQAVRERVWALIGDA